MAKVLTDSKNYEDIADAIRAKSGGATEYYPSEMAAAINELSPPNSVLYVEQNLTDTQKEQARENIGADEVGSAAIALEEAKLYADSYSNAGGITYDGVSSGLSGTSVQAAIDELNAILDSTINSIPSIDGLASETYVDEKIASIPTPDVSGQINTHNTDINAHTDIRNDIEAFADSIPTKISDLENDKGYITGYTETDPTVPAWAKEANKPAYTADEVGADKKGSASEALDEAKSYVDEKTSNLASTSFVELSIGTHNSSESAHTDIKGLIDDLTTKLNNFLDVDDTTSDQLSEVITMINNNKGTLESLTTSKINVSDIVDNLTTSSTSKVLSAKQGVAIKGLIDTLQVELNSHASNTTMHITSDERSAWNAIETNMKSYTDDAVAQKSQVQIITWEDDD